MISNDRARPLVSICCVTYNHEQFIAQCLDGFVMQQTNFTFEILVHEDASTDKTAIIVKEYEANYPQLFRCIYQNENQFQKQNTLINILFPLSRGKYLTLCEGDDYWTDPFKLQKQVDFLESSPSFSGIFHETQIIIEPSKLKGAIYGREAPDVCTPEDTISNGSLFHTSSFLFKKSAGIIPQWFTKVVSADMALFSIVAGFGPLKKIPEVMSVYRKHDASLTSSSYVINSYHQKRIELIQYLNEHHKFMYQTKAKQVIDFHNKALGHIHKTSVKKNILVKFKEKLNFKRRLKDFFS